MQFFGSTYGGIKFLKVGPNTTREIKDFVHQLNSWPLYPAQIRDEMGMGYIFIVILKILERFWGWFRGRNTLSVLVQCARNAHRSPLHLKAYK